MGIVQSKHVDPAAPTNQPSGSPILSAVAGPKFNLLGLWSSLMSNPSTNNETVEYIGRRFKRKKSGGEESKHETQPEIAELEVGSLENDRALLQRRAELRALLQHRIEEQQRLNAEQEEAAALRQKNIRDRWQSVVQKALLQHRDQEQQRIAEEGVSDSGVAFSSQEWRKEIRDRWQSVIEQAVRQHRAEEQRRIAEEERLLLERQAQEKALLQSQAEERRRMAGQGNPASLSSQIRYRWRYVVQRALARRREEEKALQRQPEEQRQLEEEEAVLLLHQVQEKALHQSQADERRRLLEEETERLRFQLEEEWQEEERKTALFLQSQAEQQRWPWLDTQSLHSLVDEGTANDIRPLVWPTQEEFEAAKARVEYNNGLLHFAVTGQSGSGKSSLINALRGLKNNDPNAAASGTVETTVGVTRYPDPRPDKPYSRFIWFDVPGAGTLKVPSSQYFNSQGLFIFDFIITVYDIRFTQIDIDILKDCERFRIPAFIVRSKANQHIRNIEDDEGMNYKEAREKHITTTRQNLESNLKDAGLSGDDQSIPRCYIVSKETLHDLASGKRKLTHRYIDEEELLQDLLLTAVNRRFQPSKKAGPVRAYRFYNAAADEIYRSLSRPLFRRGSRGTSGVNSEDLPKDVVGPSPQWDATRLHTHREWINGKVWVT